jgi:hypothetical protein
VYLVVKANNQEDMQYTMLVNVKLEAIFYIVQVFITTPGVFASGDNSLERWHLFPASSSSVESFSSPGKFLSIQSHVQV